MSASLFYIFFDEKYLDLDELRRIIIGYFAVPQDSWNRMAPDRRALKVPHNIPRIARIERILDDTLGVAALTYADLEKKLLPKGERDGTNDVPDMARSDNAWSAAVAFGLAATLRHLGRNNPDVQTIESLLRHLQPEAGTSSCIKRSCHKNINGENQEGATTEFDTSRI